MKRLKEFWHTLGISVYEGERGRQNLKAIAFISLLMEIPALVGVVFYFSTLRGFALGSVIYFILNFVVFYLAAIKKDRKATVKFIVILSLFVCTNIALFARNGFAANWTLIFPLVISYFCNVRAGILCSAYLSVLYIILYWTPLRVLFAGHGYPPIFFDRFPLLYIIASFNTAYIMIEYHLNTLKQIQYEKELETACQEAQAANKAKSEFLASMSHEIRTPLNAVLGMNTLISRDCQYARQVQEVSEIHELLENITSHSGSIDSAGNNLLSIINSILDFSKIEAGKVELASENYKLSSVLNDISNMIILRAKTKGLDFNIEVDETLPDVYCGDETRLREIFQNLLTNAVKYTNKGSVKLSVGRASTQTAKSAENDEFLPLKISVQDTGIGIKPENEVKLFKRFERLDLNRNSTVEGTGLGLAITYRLCEMMGGSIRVQSEYGKGSIFTLIIPQKLVKNSSEAIGNFHEKFEQSIKNAENYHELFTAPEAKILIVDDTKFNLIVAEGLLKKTKIQIETAMNGAEAIIKAQENNFDLILMDQRMPVMNGTEALNKIREFNITVPVICLTADAISGARAKYLSQGFTDYLTKPIDSRELEKMLVKYLPSEKIIKGNVKSEIKNNELKEFNILLEHGFEVERALKYSQNDKELYKNLLAEYVLTSDEKINSLQKFYENHDCQNYGIVIHSLKSSSKMIGAINFSQECASLEQAANDNNIAAIHDKNSLILSQYGNIISLIKSANIIDNNKNMNDAENEILEFSPEI